MPAAASVFVSSGQEPGRWFLLPMFGKVQEAFPQDVPVNMQHSLPKKASPRCQLGADTSQSLSRYRTSS